MTAPPPAPIGCRCTGCAEGACAGGDERAPTVRPRDGPARAESSVLRLDGGNGWDNSCGVADPISARVNVETADCSLMCTLW
jgi:hypothetical protein